MNGFEHVWLTSLFLFSTVVVFDFLGFFCSDLQICKPKPDSRCKTITENVLIFIFHENGKFEFQYGGRELIRFLSSASNRIIHAKDHASVQISFAEVDESGVWNRQTTAYAICGALRRMVSPDDGHFLFILFIPFCVPGRIGRLYQPIGQKKRITTEVSLSICLTLSNFCYFTGIFRMIFLSKCVSIKPFNWISFDVLERPCGWLLSSANPAAPTNSSLTTFSTIYPMFLEQQRIVDPSRKMSLGIPHPQLMFGTHDIQIIHNDYWTPTTTATTPLVFIDRFLCRTLKR